MEFTTILTYLFAVIMLGAGIMHLIKPKGYERFLPKSFPFKSIAVYLSGIVEIAVGVMLLLPFTHNYAALATLVLMVLFLPFHIYDALRLKPRIGKKAFAYFRILLQFVLILFAWLIIKPF